MRCSKTGTRPVVFCGRRRVSVVAALLIFLPPLAGCASGPVPHARVGMTPPPRVVAVAPPVEMEDDGFPVQTPPRVRRHTTPDDPSEPFSPNYGSVPPLRAADNDFGDAYRPRRPEPNAVLGDFERRPHLTPVRARPADVSRVFRPRANAAVDWSRMSMNKRSSSRH